MKMAELLSLSRGDHQAIVFQHRPSFAPQAYLRFLGIDHHIENCPYPSTSPRGAFPHLQLADRLVPARHIVPFLSRIDGTEALSAPVVALVEAAQPSLVGSGKAAVTSDYGSDRNASVPHEFPTWQKGAVYVSLSWMGG